MLDTLLFVVFPYLAFATLIFGTIYRFKYRPYGISSLSSQFLEREGVFWGSMPWHIGILIVLLGHLLSFFAPNVLRTMTSTDQSVMIVEIIGLASAFLAFIGLFILLLRRLWERKLQIVTSKMDWFVLLLILVQIVFGILLAIMYRWGSQWSVQTTTPYFWSIILFSPKVSIMADMPFIVKAHVFFSWLFILIIPFSRLIHIFTIPLQYFTRRHPQIVIWNSKRGQ
jgi:nitrate reductase gamma subunit